MGAHNIENDEPTQVRVNTPASNFILHPQYNRNLILNDIAILKMPTRVVFTPAIQPIRLPTGDQMIDLFSGVAATVSGFGRFDDSKLELIL